VTILNRAAQAQENPAPRTALASGKDTQTRALTN